MLSATVIMALATDAGAAYTVKVPDVSGDIASAVARDHDGGAGRSDSFTVAGGTLQMSLQQQTGLSGMTVSCPAGSRQYDSSASCYNPDSGGERNTSSVSVYPDEQAMCHWTRVSDNGMVNAVLPLSLSGTGDNRSVVAGKLQISSGISSDGITTGASLLADEQWTGGGGQIAFSSSMVGQGYLTVEAPVRGTLRVGSRAVPGTYVFTYKTRCAGDGGIGAGGSVAEKESTWVITVEKPDNICSVTLDNNASLTVNWPDVPFNAQRNTAFEPKSGLITISCKDYAYANAAGIFIGLGTTRDTGSWPGDVDEYRLYSGVPGWSITGRVSPAITRPACSEGDEVSIWNATAGLNVASSMVPVPIDANGRGTGHYWFALCRAEGSTGGGQISTSGYVGVYVN
jgi:hypothetical protein